MPNKKNSLEISRLFCNKWAAELKSLEKQNLKRQLKLLHGLWDFTSNDYLSLSQEVKIRQALLKELKKKDLPLGAGASRLLSGHTKWHKETEQVFQKWVGRESALFFSSGYLANLGLLSALGSDSMFFSDELNHASLIDGMRLSRAKKYIYRHKDLNHLEELLKKPLVQTVTLYKKIIVTESVFSMNGDLAPLEELSFLALKYKALLMVDEAHAVGLCGKKGAGLVTLLPMTKKEHIVGIYPCGKALSAGGAFVCGPKILKEYLINTSRTFIYSTAPSPLHLFHIQCVLKFLSTEARRRQILQKKVLFFKNELKKFLSVKDGVFFSGGVLEKPAKQNSFFESPIVPIKAPGAGVVLKLANVLQKKGYDIRAVRFPTVPKGEERLRLVIHYNHTLSQLKNLIRTVKTFF